MLYNSEIAFVNEFIANLKIRGLNKIPFDNRAFFDGVDKMASYFQEHRSALKDDAVNIADELSMLFLKNPLENTYQRFSNALSAENGSYLSFVNPEYVVAILDLSKEDAEYTVRKNRSGIPPEFVRHCADEFCVGANCQGV